MSKSRYSKTKAAGYAVGLNQYSRDMHRQAHLAPQENRQIMRARTKNGNGKS